MNENDITAETNDVIESQVDNTVVEPQPTEPVVTETVKTEPVKPTQSAEDNSRYARERREREKQQAIEQAKIDAIISTVRINPYTNQPIKDAVDVAEYNTMRKIDLDGGDPKTDYAEYVAREKRTEQETLRKKAEMDAFLQQDAESFVSKYPDVNTDSLFNDKHFSLFAGDKVGKVPLTELYEGYKAFKENIYAQARKEVEAEIVKKTAIATSATGSASGSTPPAQDLYTFEQLQNLSDSEINANWEKVQRSNNYWLSKK